MESPESSYKQIVKSSSIFGSSQLFNVVLGVIRSKLTAILLGAVGVGVFGLLQSVIDFTRSFSGLGLDIGAAKSLATVENESSDELGKTLYTISFWYLLSAILGAIACIVFSKTLSQWAFGDEEYAMHIVLLSVAVFFIALSAGLTASLQGLRKISSMALASSVGSFISLTIMIPVYYFWRIDGIVPMLILASIITFVVSFYFYKKVKIKVVKISISEIIERGQGMLRLGIYIVVAGVISTASIFLVRAFINREGGLEVTGLFQAAWLITTLFWGVVLRSTNTDFFPKLCSIIESKEAVKQFVNEQTHVVLLIVSPMIIGLVVFSKYLLYLLYTSEFMVATHVLQWHFVGAFFKIAATPVATIMLAKNRGGVHLLCESIFWSIYLLSCYLLYSSFGIEATGMAYLIAYAVYMPVVLLASYFLVKSSWNGRVIGLIIVNTILFGVLFFVMKCIDDYTVIIGIVIFMLSVLYSIYSLTHIISLRELISRINDFFN